MEITTTLQGGVPILHPHGKLVGTGIPTLREKLALWIDDTNASSVFDRLHRCQEDRFLCVGDAGQYARPRRKS